jgi:hypothetical protein
MAFVRSAMPDNGGWALLVQLPHPASCAPFAAGDVAALLPNRGTNSAEPLPTDAQVALALSSVALDLLTNRRHAQPRLPVGKQIDRLEKIAKAAADLVALLGGNPSEIFDPDIGHAPEVRAVVGLAADIEKADWQTAKESARSVSAAIAFDLPDLLRITGAAAQVQARRIAPMGGSGRRVDYQRHEFVTCVLIQYERATGRDARISRPSDGGKRYGPAPRFLRAFCDLLRDRLLPEEVAADPELPAFLRQASDKSAAWVDEAVQWDKQLPGELHALRPIRRKGAD